MTQATAQATTRDEATMVVRDKTRAADGVVTVELAAADGGRLKDWTPGAHIDVVLPNGLTRQYSLCGDRWDPWRYRIGVLREPGGEGGSAYVHDELDVGDTVGIGGPRNNFPLVPSAEYLFVAGGIGITPLLPMVQHAELLGARWRLLYGGRSRAGMALLDELATHGDRVEVRPEDEYGLLDLPGFLGDPRPGVTIYACGPAPLLDAMEQLCSTWSPRTLHTERFAGDDAGPSRAAPFEVRLARSRTSVTVPTGRSVLDVLAETGVDVLSSCRRGTCGTCETAVLAGRPEHRDAILEDDERAAGDCMFVCVSRSLSDRLVLDL